MSTSENLCLSKVGSSLLFSTVFHFPLCSYFLAVFAQRKETNPEIGYIWKQKEQCFNLLHFVAFQMCSDLNCVKKQPDVMRSEIGLLPALASFLLSSFISIPELRLQYWTSNFNWVAARSAQRFDKVMVGQEGYWCDSRKYCTWIFGKAMTDVSCFFSSTWGCFSVKNNS